MKINQDRLIRDSYAAATCQMKDNNFVLIRQHSDKLKVQLRHRMSF